MSDDCVCDEWTIDGEWNDFKQAEEEMGWPDVLAGSVSKNQSVYKSYLL